MRQAGILAAAGRYALEHHVTRLADDHARARRLAEALEPYGVVRAAAVPTNILILDLTQSTVDARTLADAARSAGVLVSVIGPRRARMITHLDVDDAGVDEAIDVITRILKS
jgi:threonine aldolase